MKKIIERLREVNGRIGRRLKICYMINMILIIRNGINIMMKIQMKKERNRRKIIQYYLKMIPILRLWK